MSISKYSIKEKAKRNKKSITLSVEKAVLDELQQEAEQKMESVNTLVNQIIKSYLQWHKPAKKAGLGYLSKTLMAKSINHLTDEQVIKMTEEFCKLQLNDILYMLRNENTFASFMDGLCPWLDASGFTYRLESNDDDKTDLYKIQFDMGKKWSLHFKTRMQFVFEHYNIKNAEAEMANNTVILKIKRES